MLPLNYILSHHLHMAGYTLKFLLPLLLYVFSFSPMLLYYIIGSRERKSTRIYYNFLSNTEISFDGWQTTKNLVRTCYIVMVVCVCRKQLAYILIGLCYCGDFTVNIVPAWRSTTRRNLRWNLLSKHGSGSSSALSHQTSRTNTWRSTAHGLWFHSRNTQRTGNGRICYTQTRATVSNQNKQMREDSDVLFFLYNSLNLNATAQHTAQTFPSSWNNMEDLKWSRSLFVATRWQFSWTFSHFDIDPLNGRGRNLIDKKKMFL